MEVLRTLGLFVDTALAEIVGCYLPYLYLRLKKGAPARVLLPSAISLALFAWLWAVDSVPLTRTDCIGMGVCLHSLQRLPLSMVVRSDICWCSRRRAGAAPSA